MQNKLFTYDQSGFIPGDSCLFTVSDTENLWKFWLPHIIHLDISKALDKVSHEDLIFKSKTYGADGNRLKLLETDCHQKVVLNGQTSSWQNIYAGIPQGSVLGPLLLLICFNDFSDGLTWMCKIFADETSFFSKVIDKNNSNSQPISNLAKISKWAFQRKMSFNPDLNKQAIEVRFSNKRDKENIRLCNLTVHTKIYTDQDIIYLK